MMESSRNHDLPRVTTMNRSRRISCMSIMKTILLLISLDFFVVLPLSGAVIAEHGDSFSSVITSNPMETTECEKYNRTSCEAGDPDCQGTELCNMHKDHQHVRCYVLWTNSSEGKVDVEYKGCFYGDHSCHLDTKCIARHEHNPVTDKMPYIYCCCNSNNCNTQFWQSPKPQAWPPVDQDNGVILMVLCPLGAFAVLGLVVVVIYYCYRKSKMLPYFHPLPNGMSDCTSSAGGVGGSSSLPESISQHTAVSTLPAVPHKPVKLLEVKAKGRFGALWMAQRDTEYVAVKIFPHDDHESWHIEKEVYGLPQFRHTNILEFMGVQKCGGDHVAEYWLISAYHYRGSLSDYLKSHTVSWPEVRRIGLTMAEGLRFLHEEFPATDTEAAKPVIAHRDFKSKNVLLKADLTACIADFGLAIVFYPGQSSRDTHGQVGTRRYMAPEVLEGAIDFQTDAFLRIDMYACGLVLWELLSRCTGLGLPLQHYKLPFEEEVGYHPTLDDMQECVVVQKCRPAIKPHWRAHPGVEVLVSTMEECWDHDFEARLTAACVVERLSAIANYDGFVVSPSHLANQEPPSCHRPNITSPPHVAYPGHRALKPAPPDSFSLSATNYSCSPLNRATVTPYNGKMLLPLDLQNGSVSLSSSGVSIPDKYNGNNSSGSSNNSSCRSSNSGGSDSVIQHHVALSNSIPRPLIGAKPVMPPSVNVPLPISMTQQSGAKISSDGRFADQPQPTVMVPVMSKPLILPQQQQPHKAAGSEERHSALPIT